MIHEKLKATNSNEFIIEDMDEISKRVVGGTMWSKQEWKIFKTHKIIREMKNFAKERSGIVISSSKATRVTHPKRVQWILLKTL